MDRLLTTEEVAEILGKRSWWVRENMESVGLPGIKIGRQWRFRPTEIEDWLDSHKQNA
jgi:excisionase family DNA binding protein